MSVVMKIVFSLSLSGSILIVVLLLCKSLVKNRFSRQWQYYIWLVVIARLLLPIAPETNIVGALFTNMNQIDQAEDASIQASTAATAEKGTGQAVPMEESSIQDQESGQSVSRALVVGDSITKISIDSVGEKLLQNLWIPWLAAALLLLFRKVTIYQSFVKYVKAGHREISDTDLLDRLAQIGEQTGVRRPVELYVNSLVSSPLLIGFLRPCIILPTADLTKEDFTYTVWHELIHYKRKDMFYKWLVQFTVCLHWFNPLVWLMGREINRACELSCDEAVVRAIGEEERRAYGDMLMRAMGTGGSFRDYPVSVTLNESADLLKERLGAIMKFRKSSKLVTTISVVSAAAMAMGATVMGAYVEPVKIVNVAQVEINDTSIEPTEIENTQKQKNGKQNIEYESAGAQSALSGNVNVDDKNRKSMEELAAQYYEADMPSQFGAVFSALDESAQRRWLDKVYTDDASSFFSAAVFRLDSGSPLIAEYAKRAYADDAISFFAILTGSLGSGSPLIAEYAERAYADGAIDFFSVLVGEMNADLYKSWQDRAKEEDMAVGFQYILMDSEDLEQWKLKAEQEDAIQYQEWGIIRNGQDFYYQNQLVRVFFDAYDGEQAIRTLQWNPAGTVDVKVTRSIRNEILSVAYMTEEEVTALFGGEELPDWNFAEEESDAAKRDSEAQEKKYQTEEGASDPEYDVYRLTAEELPADVVGQMMDDGAVRTWYVYHSQGRQYLCYRGFAWSYGYQLKYDENGWQINIQRFQKKDYSDSDVFLALPDNGPVTVYCDGEKVELTEVVR
ncbi:MAG: M56 family metallopeptidase [Lachnospiraceae bacterium]|nr:M56 family metallopeptidase [Lachnospiraceae bacterium]